MPSRNPSEVRTYRHRKSRCRFFSLHTQLSPYVKVSLSPHETKTTDVIVNGGTCVDFTGGQNEFDFYIGEHTEDGKVTICPSTGKEVKASCFSHSSLVVEAWDEDGNFQLDHWIGTATICLKECQQRPNEVIYQVVNLLDETQTENCGDLEISLEYRTVDKLGLPSDSPTQTFGLLHLSIYKAINLRDIELAEEFISIKMAVLIFCIYFFLGVSVMTHFEDLELTDAIYFCIVAMFTIGYGDIVPKTPGGKLFIALFLISGIGLIATASSVFLNWIIENKAKRIVVDLNANEVGITKKLFAIRENAMLAQKKLENIDENKEQDWQTAWTTYGSLFSINSETNEDDGDDESKFGSIKSALLSPIGRSAFLVLANLIFGSIGYYFLEDRNFINAFYFTCCSLTSVGFGDLSFHSHTGRSFAIIWIIVGTMSMARMLSLLIDSKSKQITQRATEKRRKRLLLRQTDFSLLDKTGKGKISRLEFLVYELVALQLCEKWQITEILERFDALDVDKNDELDAVDFKLAQQKQIDALQTRIITSKLNIKRKKRRNSANPIFPRVYSMPVNSLNWTEKSSPLVDERSSLTCPARNADRTYSNPFLES